MSITELLPVYRCHKLVRAAKIQTVHPQCTLARATRGVLITPADEGVPPFIMPLEFIEKHAPEPGGYIVAYADGYISYSPAKAFEEGYTKL